MMIKHIFKNSIRKLVLRSGLTISMISLIIFSNFAYSETNNSSPVPIVPTTLTLAEATTPILPPMVNLAQATTTTTTVPKETTTKPTTTSTTSTTTTTPASTSTTSTTTTIPAPTSTVQPVIVNPDESTTIKQIPDDVIKSSLPQSMQVPVSNKSVPTDIDIVPAKNSIDNQTTLRSSGGTISFYFQNVAVKTLLQLIAKNSGLNFIISDDVKGNTTLNLKNVTWRQALDIIMQSNGLASRQIGSALFISTTEDIAQKQASEYKASQDIINMSPLSTAFINLKYSDAAVIAKVLKSADGSLLTPRGEVTINSPTNSIIIRDIKNNLVEIRKFINRLDIPARQVSIEARIVNIDTLYEAQLGVRFGLSNSRSLSGTLAGASQLAAGTSVADILPIDQRLNFDIPANLLSNGLTPGSIGLALARLGPVLLDLELSALEEDGHSQIISKPRVVTANQQKARIETGEEIPYQQATSSGATSTEFKKAVLSLEITPQITPDDRIVLKLKATQDTRGPQLLVAQGGTQATAATATGAAGVATSTPAVFGPPTINTQEVESYVILNDNETVVIGGVYKLSKTNTFDRIPFFGALPIIGPLFRHRGIKNQRTELLIFLTPKIIRQHARSSEYPYNGATPYAYKGN